MTAQDLPVRDPAQAVVWAEVKAKVKVEAEWVDHSPRGRAASVFARSAAKEFRT